MSETKELLKRLAIQIRDERKIGANTAQRVGSFLLSLVESGEDIEELAMYFLRKDQPDETRFLINFLAGATFGNFNEGPLGTGACVKIDPATGKSYVEVDELFVRMKAYFQELVIEKLSHVGGNVILSPARMQCIKVEEFPDFYRCFFLATDGEKTIDNEFAVDDQVTIRQFNVKPDIHQNVSNRYYWRLVVGIGDDYIDLSKVDCDAGSDMPLPGDDICQLGNRSDKSRQNAIILSSFGSGSPCIQHYKGINSFSLVGKKVTEIGEDSAFTGKVTIGKGSTGFENLEDKPDIAAINKAILDALGIATEAIQVANEIQETVNELDDVLDGTFADGIIEKSEAKAIEKYINTINNTKSAVEATYNKLYLNAYLEGTPKTALLNAKVSLFGSISALISGINSAIADGKVTTVEKNNVDSKFSLFNSAYADFNTAVESANKSIQDKLKSYADKAQQSADKVQTSLNNIPLAVKNSIAQNLGYISFAALEAAASKGTTIIKDGKINTELIEATAIITAQVIADAIRTNTLNVNNKFIVEKDGTFKGVGGEMKDMLLTGAFRTPFKSGRFRWDSDGGPIYVETEGLQNNNNVIIPNSDTHYAILHCDLPASMDYDGFNATIINDNYNGVRTHGSISLNVPPGYAIYDDGVKKDSITVPVRAGVDIQGFSDGTAFRGWIVKNRFKSSESDEPEYGAVVGLASPEAGGQVIGDGDKIIGTTGTLTAIPNKGYEFSHWHDDLKTPSRQVTWTSVMQTFRAYFVIAETYYTITVKASPINGGVVTGGGRKLSDTTGFIKAVPNDGYAFTHWNDGNTETDRLVTWDADKTYTAYFTVHTPTGELLTNNTLKDTTGVASLLVDMVGENSIVAFNGVLIWGINNYVSGTTRAITFNKGYLAGKLAAGRKYRFTVDVSTVLANVGKHIMIVVGTIADPMVGSLDETVNHIGIGDTIMGHELTENYVTLSLEFTASRTSLATDCIGFISDSVSGVIHIKNPSLKEI